jgi:NAD(P)-dependent dehydrogenase (short-subunit alcohol dehydrogenase family)
MAPTRSVIVTGGTLNLGYYAALEIAREHPDYLVVISSRSDRERSAEKINRTLGQKNVVFTPLDLSDLDSVRNYAKDWATKDYPPIQALVCNAALQFPGALTTTPSGVEATFAISNVGHALLFHLLCPYLAPKARITVVSSGTHDPAQKTGLPDAVYNTAEELAHPPPSMININGRQRYASSKLANVLWTYALDRKLKQRVPERGICVNAFDPGLMPGTGLAREASWVGRFLWLHVLPRVIPLLRLLVLHNVWRPEDSGKALAHIAVGTELEGVSGKYFEHLKEIKSSTDSYNESKQEDLWDWLVKYTSNGDPVEMARFNEFK